MMRRHKHGSQRSNELPDVLPILGNGLKLYFFLSTLLSLPDIILWNSTLSRSLLMFAKYPYCKQHESLG